MLSAQNTDDPSAALRKMAFELNDAEKFPDAVKRINEAISAAKKAKLSDDAVDDLNLSKAIFQRDAGDTDAAALTLNAVMKRHLQNRDTLYNVAKMNLIKLYIQLRQPAKAKPLLDEFFSDSQNSSDGAFRLSGLLTSADYCDLVEDDDLRRTRLESALELTSKSEKKIDGIRPALDIVSVYFDTGLFEKAAQLADSAVEVAVSSKLADQAVCAMITKASMQSKMNKFKDAEATVGEALKLANEAQYKTGWCEAMQAYAEILIASHKPLSAISVLKKVDEALKDTPRMFISMNNASLYGDAFDASGDVESALKYYLAAYQTADKYRLNSKRLYLANSLSNTYDNLGKTKESLIYLRIADELVGPKGKMKFRLRIESNTVKNVPLTKRLDLTVEYYKNVKKNKYAVAESTDTLGGMLALLGDYSSSSSVLLVGLKGAELLGDVYGQYNHKMVFSELLYYNEKYSEAAGLVGAALKHLEGTESPKYEQLRMMHMLALCYAKAGDLKSLRFAAEKGALLADEVKDPQYVNFFDMMKGLLDIKSGVGKGHARMLTAIRYFDKGFYPLDKVEGILLLVTAEAADPTPENEKLLVEALDDSTALGYFAGKKHCIDAFEGIFVNPRKAAKAKFETAKQNLSPYSFSADRLK
jgi:tetratricopeptide (TPR) repeat protein